MERDILLHLKKWRMKRKQSIPNYKTQKQDIMNDLSFLAELIARWKAKSPTFFKVITTLATITAFITGIPTLLNDFGVTLPAILVPFENKTIAIAAIVGGI